jgi:hypothetical protein
MVSSSTTATRSAEVKQMEQRTDTNSIKGSPELALLGGASEHRGRTLTRDAVVVGSVALTGVWAYMVTVQDSAGPLGGALHVVSLLGLMAVFPFIFGVSLRSIVSSSVASAALLGAVVAGVLFAANDYWHDYAQVGLPFIVVSASWLVGAIIGTVSRWALRMVTS